MNDHSDLRSALRQKLEPAGNPDLPFLALCIPAMDFVHTTLVTDIVQLMHHCMSRFAGFHPIVVRDTILQRSRTVLAKTALENERVTHILFLDTDMRFPPDVAERLIARDKDIIGVNYRHRRVEIDSTARDMNDSWVDSGTRDGVEEVLHTGTGMLMIKRRVFDKIKKPWFETCYRDIHDDWLGEDVYFCIRAREAGFKVWVDHDLSKQVTHQGTYEFGWT